MRKCSKLGEVKKGSSVIVDSIEGDELRSKLLEFGLTKGSKLNVLYTAPLGDPIAVDIEGFVLSLRKSEANLIQVLSN
ncbi:MAG TPA: FeoA domain-containing protein [Taishania sp.]|nr:FeoA domain-containing protein [Taishania sp.]